MSEVNSTSVTASTEVTTVMIGTTSPTSLQPQETSPTQGQTNHQHIFHKPKWLIKESMSLIIEPTTSTEEPVRESTVLSLGAIVAIVIMLLIMIIIVTLVAVVGVICYVRARIKYGKDTKNTLTSGVV